ncbi:hypothetical protein ACHAPV_007283 [Trichoderma viride]
MSSSDGTAADASWERSDGRSRPPPTVNTIRRIRQACTNCRNGENQNGSVAFPDLAAATGYQEVSPKFTEPSPPQHQYPPSVPETTNTVPDLSSTMRFTTAPPPAVMDHLIDAYFLHVHNQPYSYFHEQSFRERVNYGLIPKCLLFAILASALKFSDIEYFQGSIREATEAYAREAWLAILHEHLTVENNPTLAVAQASNILGVVDFTCGRTSSGWLKIGLAVRIAQDLQLMREPKNTLSPIEQEEHRRAFWSIYLLDKLVSVGQSRPPAIAEEDIHVQLPSDEETLRRGIWKKTPTLHQLINWKSETESSVNGTFTQTILAATALGRCCRYVLHGREMDEMPPWDPRSDFTLLNTFLLLIDHHLQVETPPIPQIVEQYRRPDGTLDFQSLEHVVLVEDAIASGCHVQSSFYAYASILAGGILSLAIHIDQEKGQVTDPETLNHYQKAIHILERTGRRWDHASKMHLQLMLFDANYHSLAALVDSQTPEVDPKLESALWLMVDYVAMSALNETALTPPPLSTDTFLSPLNAQMSLDSNDGFSGLGPDANSDPNVAFLGNGVPL